MNVMDGTDLIQGELAWTGPLSTTPPEGVEIFFKRLSANGSQLGNLVHTPRPATLFWAAVSTSLCLQNESVKLH